MNLAALKVKIGMKTNGNALYPDFNALPSVEGDWSIWIDMNGPGWLYDKLTGHKDDTIASPFGQQWGVILAPEAFVDEAVAAFPAACSRVTEAELDTFYTEQIAPMEDDDRRDEGVLSGFAALKQLSPNDAGLDARIAKALDPDDPTPGIRGNPRKDWATFKAAQNITVVDKT